MKLLCIIPLLIFTSFADEAKAPPLLTAADREPLHAAFEALQSDQIAAGRIEADQKAVNEALQKLQAKCGVYGIVGQKPSEIQCGTKPVTKETPK